MKKTKKLIIILGPDGCGKTTLADLVTLHFKKEKNVANYNFSFSILPTISQILGRSKEKNPEGLKNSGMVNPLGHARCLVLTIWYGIDYVLGWIKIKDKQNDLVICARSYHDFFYQRAYLQSFSTVVKFFLWLGPKPDLIIVPVRKSKDIYDKKPELNRKEIELQYKRIKKNLENYNYFVEIDASNGLKKTVDKTLKTINNF